MGKTPVNLIYEHEIEVWLSRFSGEDNQLDNLVQIALKRILRKRPENMVEVEKCPADAPDWMTKKWETAKPWHRFDPKQDIRLPGHVYHIVKWLQKALEVDAHWLDERDDNSRPVKLLKPATLEDLFDLAERDQNALKLQALGQDRTGDISTILRFDDRKSIVRLNTLEAVHREGGLLQHCLLHGYYDDLFTAGDVKLYSLRSKDNKPLVTFCVYPDDKCISEIRGRKDEVPPAKHWPYINMFIAEYGLFYAPLAEQHKEITYRDNNEFQESFYFCNYDESLYETDYCDRHPLVIRDNFTTHQDLYISRSTIEKLPEGLTIYGDLYMYGMPVMPTAPRRGYVQGHIYTDLDIFEDFECYRLKYG